MVIQLIEDEFVDEYSDTTITVPDSSDPHTRINVVVIRKDLIRSLYEWNGGKEKLGREVTNPLCILGIKGY
jgi:hypothetical protein